MLQFIVLGQVPGTSIYLSFNEVASALAFLGFALIFYFMLLPKRIQKKILRSIHDIAL